MKTKAQRIKEAEARVVQYAIPLSKDIQPKTCIDRACADHWCLFVRAVAALKKAKGGE